MASNLYNDFDFSILDTPDFKEDSVREELILPLLKELNYKPVGRNKIIRSKSLQHPFVKVGSGSRNINSIPDYLMEVSGRYTWVLDAKSPDEEIRSGEHREQAYFYAIHPEIRVNYYALCNGREFVLFKIDSEYAILHFHLSEIDKHWNKIKVNLSPDAFIQTAILSGFKQPIEKEPLFDYDKIQVPKAVAVRKQEAKRHFGVHGYFTKQSWNIVEHYIKTFTKPGDLVLDPFGGSGITLVEALMLYRKAIHIDLNPLSAFMVKALIVPVKLGELSNTFESIKSKFVKNCPVTKVEIDRALAKYAYPQNISLPKDADVSSIEELFTDKQLAQLAYLKHLILQIKDENIRLSLLLSFSSSVNKYNRTFHYTKSKGGGGGDSGPFRYYRYRIAPEPPDLKLIEIFETKYKKLFAAKKEMQSSINNNTIANALILKSDAANLYQIESESVDYIYTDPPYGSKIAYLDLSTMWNAWLDLEVFDEDFEKEVIEGGSREKSCDEYNNLLAASIKEMYRVLKYGRWLSFVFAHKDPKYWHLIIETAEKVGFEYAGAVAQNNGQTSFKKRQNPFSVLSGQLIINFRKVRSPQAIQKVRLGAEIYDLIIETIEAVIAENDGATLEQINAELILKGLELGFLDILSNEYKDISPILRNNFDFDDISKIFQIRPNKSFKTNIPLDLRIRYFLISYLKRKEKQNVYPTTDDIILDIMPLLRNGITPENQTILSVLKKIAKHIGDDRWKLTTSGQTTLFGVI